MRTTLTTLAILAATLPTVALLSYQTGRMHGVADTKPAREQVAVCAEMRVQLALIGLRQERVMDRVAQERDERDGFTSQTGGT